MVPMEPMVPPMEPMETAPTQLERRHTFACQPTQPQIYLGTPVAGYAGGQGPWKLKKVQRSMSTSSGASGFTTQPLSRSSGGARGPRGSSSRYRGVTQHRRTKRWEAHVWDQGKQVYLG